MEIELITTFGSFRAVSEVVTMEDAASKAAELVEKGIYLEDGTLLRLTSPGQLLAVRVSPPAIELVELDEQSESEEFDPLSAPYNRVAFWDGQKVSYLGNRYTASFITKKVQGKHPKVYVLLFELDGKPAAHTLSDKSQDAVICEWINQYNAIDDAGRNTAWTFFPVIPHGAIEDMEEAAEYLNDYIQETEPGRKPAEPNAKAFTSWKGDK